MVIIMSVVSKILSKECVCGTARKLSSSLSGIPSSYSFSGAGFLGCYHVGASDCLIKHGLLPSVVDATTQPLLTGVSAGALIVAGISAGVSTDDSMNVVLQVAKRTREQTGVLNSFQPGFSLVDQLEDIFTSTMIKALGGSGDSSVDSDDYDWELLMKRTNHGVLMRIGLTDFTQLQLSNFMDTQQPNPAYVYVDQFRDLQDLLSACLLSSYIPFGTGPLQPTTNDKNKNTAVQRAAQRLHEMTQLGFVKCGSTGQPLNSLKHYNQQQKIIKNTNDKSAKRNNYSYLDGGLVENWPIVDSQTVIITPIQGHYHPNPSIAPDVSAGDHQPTFKVREGVLVGVNADNAKTFALMLKSSADETLQSYFRDGYDDASKWNVTVDITAPIEQDIYKYFIKNYAT